MAETCAGRFVFVFAAVVLFASVLQNVFIIPSRMFVNRIFEEKKTNK